MRYDYPEYAQLHPPYDGQVSILDLLFMTGPNALDYIAVPVDVPEPEPELDVNVLSGFHVVDSAAACQARSGPLFDEISPQPLQTDNIKSSFRSSV
jgi:hypothetical protein